MIKIILSFILILILISACIIFIGCEEQEQQLGKKFSYDDDGMLLINGQRTFIIGTYHLPKSEKPYQELAQAGFNYVRIAAKKETLDEAHNNGLMTWISTGSIRENDEEEDQKRFKELLAKFRTHPSLLCWEIEDEPAYTWKSAQARIEPHQLIKTYQLIKQEDPLHLVYTNHAPVNLISTMQQYNPGTDIIACDIYPVIPHGIRITYALNPDGLQGDLLNPYLSQVGEYTDKMHAVSQRRKPVWMVLQGFAWEMLRKIDDRDPAMIRYPTYDETRFMAYNAIIHGATGIVYWGTAYTPQPSNFWSDLKKVTAELSESKYLLEAPRLDWQIQKVYHEMGHSIDAGVEILVKNIHDKTYMITANADKNLVKVSFKVIGNSSKAKVLNEDRVIEVQDNTLTDTYRPFDVHVYELYEN